jgi:hypothetical protein
MNNDPSGHMPLLLPLVCVAGGCEAVATAAAGAAALVGSAAAAGWGISKCINHRNTNEDDNEDEDDKGDHAARCTRKFDSQNAFCRTLKNKEARAVCYTDAQAAYARCLAKSR